MNNEVRISVVPIKHTGDECRVMSTGVLVTQPKHWSGDGKNPKVAGKPVLQLSLAYTSPVWMLAQKTTRF